MSEAEKLNMKMEAIFRQAVSTPTQKENEQDEDLRNLGKFFLRERADFYDEYLPKQETTKNFIDAITNASETTWDLPYDDFFEPDTTVYKGYKGSLPAYAGIVLELIEKNPETTYDTYSRYDYGQDITETDCATFVNAGDRHYAMILSHITEVNVHSSEPEQPAEAEFAITLPKAVIFIEKDKLKEIEKTMSLAIDGAAKENTELQELLDKKAEEYRSTFGPDKDSGPFWEEEENQVRGYELEYTPGRPETLEERIDRVNATSTEVQENEEIQSQGIGDDEMGDNNSRDDDEPDLGDDGETL